MPDTRMTAEYQRKVDAMVHQNVLVCLSHLVAECGAIGGVCDELFYPADWTIDNKRECVSDAGWTLRKRANGRWHFVSGKNHIDEDDGGYENEEEALNDCIDGDGLEVNEREIFEYWAVSAWFAERLREQGETVRDWADLKVWCRTITGQAISMDCTICDLYDASQAYPSSLVAVM
jgi:hypothetical protein